MSHHHRIKTINIKKKREKADIKHDVVTFTDYSQRIDDIYENLKD